MPLAPPLLLLINYVFFQVNVFLGSLEYTALCDMINCQ